jgi:hypothetical protein
VRSRVLSQTEQSEKLWDAWIPPNRNGKGELHPDPEPVMPGLRQGTVCDRGEGCMGDSKRIDVSAFHEKVSADHPAVEGKNHENGIGKVNNAEQNSDEDCRGDSVPRQRMNPVHEVAVEENLLKKSRDEIGDESERRAKRETSVSEETGVSVSTDDQNNNDPGGEEEPETGKPFEAEMGEAQTLKRILSQHPARHDHAEREERKERECLPDEPDLNQNQQEDQRDLKTPYDPAVKGHSYPLKNRTHVKSTSVWSSADAKSHQRPVNAKLSV